MVSGVLRGFRYPGVLLPCLEMAAETSLVYPTRTSLAIQEPVLKMGLLSSRGSRGKTLVHNPGENFLSFSSKGQSWSYKLSQSVLWWKWLEQNENTFFLFQVSCSKEGCYDEL